MIFASASVGGGGVGYHSCLHRLLHSFLSVTHFCCSTFIWKWRISLSLSSWLMLHIHSFTRAHTWELWRARTHAHTPLSLFSNEPKCLIHIKWTYWIILLNCSLSANRETRCVRCKHQTVHVWSRNVSYFSRSFASRSVHEWGSTSKSWMLIVSFTFMEELRGRTWISALVSGGSSQVPWICGEKHKDGGNSVRQRPKITSAGTERSSHSVKSIPKQRQSLIVWPFKGALAISLPLVLMVGGGCSAHPMDQRTMSWGQNPKKTCSLSHLGLIKGMKCRLSAFSELVVWLIAADVTFWIWEVQKEQEDTF